VSLLETHHIIANFCSEFVTTVTMDLDNCGFALCTW